MPKYPYAIWLLAFIGVGWLWIGPFQTDINTMVSGKSEKTDSEVSSESDKTTEAAKLPDFSLYYVFEKTAPENEKALKDLAKKLIASYEEGKALEIIGSYFANEQGEDGSNIGLNRASYLSAEIGDKIPGEFIIERANPLEATVADDDRLNANKVIMLEMLTTNWLNVENTEKESVEELADKVVIRFPYNSTEKIQDPAVDEYLDKLSTRIKESAERITLVGHTDSKGPEDSNMKLGKNRALAIYNLLISKGVSKDQIDVSSMGEALPVASNDSESGMKENRRVELKIIEQN
jgi:outer membrane protein OmpA-like peptidoglycan-associated protein